MKWIALIPVLVVIATGCTTQKGSPAVYDRINAMTDCASLQHEFDQADENRSISNDPSIQTDYMRAADDRMSELGCY